MKKPFLWAVLCVLHWGFPPFFHFSLHGSDHRSFSSLVGAGEVLAALAVVLRAGQALPRAVVPVVVAAVAAVAGGEGLPL